MNTKIELAQSLTCQIKFSGPFVLERFMSLFIPGGPLESLGENIFGIVPLKQLNTYNVSFKRDKTHDSSKVMEETINRYNQYIPIELPCHTKIEIRFFHPKTPPKTITLWPVPHEMSWEQITQIVDNQQWGKAIQYSFGKHKKFPQFRNAYLHIQVENAQEKNIPNFILINDQEVLVLKPGESNSYCRRCKTKNHNNNNCPLNKTTTPSATYANATKNTLNYKRATQTLNQTNPKFTKHDEKLIKHTQNLLNLSKHQHNSPNTPSPCTVKMNPITEVGTSTALSPQREKKETTSRPVSPDVLPKSDNKLEPHIRAPPLSDEDEEISAETENMTTPKEIIDECSSSAYTESESDSNASLASSSSGGIPKDPITTLFKHSPALSKKKRRRSKAHSHTGMTPPIKNKNTNRSPQNTSKAS